MYISPSWFSNFIIDDFMMFLNQQYHRSHNTVVAVPGSVFQTVVRNQRNLRSKKPLLQACGICATPLHQIKVFLVSLLIHNCHFIIMKVETETSSITFYDSMTGTTTDETQRYYSKIMTEYLDSSISTWNISLARSCPKQQNSFDCGPISCRVAEYLYQNTEPTFNPNQSSLYRLYVAWSNLGPLSYQEWLLNCTY